MCASVPPDEEMLEGRIAGPSPLAVGAARPLAPTTRRTQQEKASASTRLFVPVRSRRSYAPGRGAFFEHNGLELRRTLLGRLQVACGDIQGGSTHHAAVAAQLFPEEIRARAQPHVQAKGVSVRHEDRRLTTRSILDTYLNTGVFSSYKRGRIEMAAPHLLRQERAG